MAREAFRDLEQALLTETPSKATRTSYKGITTSNKKLLVTRAWLLVTRLNAFIGCLVDRRPTAQSKAMPHWICCKFKSLSTPREEA